jgi:hypothetical protein
MRTSTPITQHEYIRPDGKPIVPAAGQPPARPGLHARLAMLHHVRLSQLTALVQGGAVLVFAAMQANSVWRQGWDGMALLGLLALAGAAVSWRLLHQPAHALTAARAARWPHRD